MKRFIASLVFLTILFSIHAQSTKELFMPKEIKKAYEDGTRAYDGKPGTNYFQNTTDYQIKAEFNPETRTITGSETITYKNNSKDSLSHIYIKLYQDLFKKGSARNWDLGPVDIHDGVLIKSLKINNSEIALNSIYIRRNATNMRVNLPEKILPKSITKIEIDWEVIIPGTIPVRMGTYHGTNFMIAYWYPKMAVYDDIRGWNSVPHTGSCEYYNEFGDFEVEITVPKEYNVWSSGLLQNAKEIYSKKYLDKMEKAANSDEIIRVITKEGRLENKITKDAEKHTYKFKARNLPDFAFAVSNSYLWDATSVKVGNNRVLVHAVYYENSKDFHEVADLSRKIIDYFSTECPAIEFPYPQMVAFNGSGGMEFPGMVNDGDASNRDGTIYLTAHEIGHTYFPFYTGLNEQRYAWMDEGLISFLPQKVVAEYTDDKSYVPFKSTVSSYNYYAGTEIEIPLMVSSINTGLAYRYHAYSRSSTAFYMLYELIGEEKFNKGLQEFAKRWESKHPTPYDFFFTFNEIAGEDLGWFWKPWFFELGCADLALENVSEKKGKKAVKVLNKGGFPVPIKLKVVYKNGTENVIERPISAWKNEAKSIVIPLPEGKISYVVLDSEMVPDAFSENNRIEL
jgi:hypothetical protein